MRKLILLLALLLPLSALADTQIYSHSFAGDANSATLPAGWVVLQGTMRIDTGKLECTAAPCLVVRNGETYPPDQYATIKASAWTLTPAPGVAVRITDAANNDEAHCTTASGNVCSVFALRKNESSILQTISSAATGVSNFITLKAVGSTLSFWRDSTQLGTNSTDSTNVAGYPGIYFNASSTSYGIVSFEAGNIGNPAAATPTLTAAPVQMGAALTFSTATAGCGSYIHWNTTGSPIGTDTLGTTATMGAASTTYYAKVIGCPTYSDSIVGSQLYSIAATPTVTPAAGSYLTAQSLALACASPSSAIYYTTDGSTPTTSSTPYTAPFSTVTSGVEAVKSLCAASGYGNSPVASMAFSILAASSDTPVASDDFTSDYNPHVGNARVTQNPVDTIWTHGAWQQVPTNTGNGYFSTQPPAFCTANSGYCVYPGINPTQWTTPMQDSGFGTALMNVLTSGTLGAGQSESVYVFAGGTAGGPCTRTSVGVTMNGYCVQVTPNTAGAAFASTVDFGKFVSGTWTSLYKWTGTGISSPVKVTLRSLGATHQVLLNDVVFAGFESISNSTFVSGQPAIYSNRTFVSNSVSSGVGNSTYAPVIYVPANPTYHVAADASFTQAWPWLQAPIPITLTQSQWAYPLTEYATGVGLIPSPGNYDIGGEIKFMGEFADEQWFQATWTHDTAVPGNYWMGLMIKNQSWEPGADDGQCASHGIQCGDTIAYAITTEVARGTGPCPVADKEVCGTPFAYAFKYTPQASPWNQEYDFPATAWSPRVGDGVYLGWYQSRLRAYCKAGTATSRWQANHAYAMYDYYLDRNGNYQVIDTAGTSGATEPVTYGASWDYNVARGVQTTSGTVLSEFFGAPCPAAPSNGGWALIFDTPETDLAGQGGQPAIGAHMGPSTYAFPLFTDIYMGSGHNAAIDTVYGIEQPKPWVLN